MNASLSLVIYHAMRIRSIIFSVASPALPHFPTLSHKRYDFREKKEVHVILHKTCFFYFPYNFCLKHFWFLEEFS